MADYPEQPQTPTSQIGRNFVGGLATSLGQTRLGGSAFVTSAQTPFGNGTKELLSPDEKKLEKRREWLYSELKDRGETMDFYELLRNLGLPPVDEPFKENAPKLFQSLAECAPFLNKNKMAQTRMEGLTKPQPLGEFEGSDFFKAVNEKAITSYFQRLVDLMHDEAMRHNECSRKAAKHSQLVPEFVYRVADHQAKEVPRSGGHKMDVVFFYARQSMNINNVHIIVEAKLAGVGDPMDEKTFAQIADYQYCLWKKQRTRAFVPVFLVHGSQLDLVVFTRGRWYRIELGPICHERQVVRKQDIQMVQLTMARLYYLITLPPESFGHICDVSQGQQHLCFAEIAGEDSIVAAVTSSREPSADSVNITGYVERFVHPRGRLAHVFKLAFRMQKAILKLSWTPVDRTPEGAIYEVLESAGVEGIPKVFGRGLLKEDVFGFRLEYLILEDCGKQVGDFVTSGNQGKLGSDELYNVTKDVVGQTLRCLAQARVKANILHRDISMGNIMVSCDGAVKIIDWGYAKVIDDASFDASDEATRDRRVLLDTIAKRWRYDSAKVLQNEDDHDPLTGTPLYMSIPVLAGAKKRGLADDIESLFYVILHALTKLQTTRDSAVCGFDYHDNKTQVMVRAGCLALEKHFLHFFGVSSCSDDLRRLLCDLRKFLFVSSDGCIASGLVIDPDTPRGAVDLLQPYVDVDTMRLLLRKGEAALTPMKSAVQVRSIEPLDPPASGPLVNNLFRKRAKSTELTESSAEKSEEDPFGTVSKRPKH